MKVATRTEDDLTEQVKASVKQAKTGKRPRTTIAILGKGVSCAMTAEGEFILPEDQGLCADLLYRARNRRLEIEREADRVGELESLLKEHFINTLAVTTGLAGRVALVKVEPKPVPQVSDFPAFYAYIKKTGSFDLLQRRLNETAVNERLDSGKKVPGKQSTALKK